MPWMQQAKLQHQHKQLHVSILSAEFPFNFKPKGFMMGEVRCQWNFGPASLWDCRLLPGSCHVRVKDSHQGKTVNIKHTLLARMEHEWPLTVRLSEQHYPLVICDIAIENGPVEIVSFPIKQGGSFHSCAKLPEVNPIKLEISSQSHLNPI